MTKSYNRISKEKKKKNSYKNVIVTRIHITLKNFPDEVELEVE